MTKQRAIHYGQVELIPGIICDGYVLDNGTAVMDEKDTAKLLGIDHMVLNCMRTESIPKAIKPFLDKNFIMETKLVLVTTPTSPYQGQKITVYNSTTIENLARGYALALAAHTLKPNQHHIGRHCVNLVCSLVRTASIKKARALNVEIQKTAQKHYSDATELFQDFGFQCSLENIATKKDIVDFLKIPQSTLNSFLYKHSNEIKPIKLNASKIKSTGSKARRMNGYHIDDVAKIAFGMDTQIGIELKKKMFGTVGAFAKTHSRDEIQWKNIFSKVFAGFDLHHNYHIGKYRYKVDFFVPQLLLCLECNGYSHRYYNPQEEQEREKIITQEYGLIRFHHKIEWEKLVNAILQIKPGEIIRLYDLENMGNN